ncbi:MAG: hypothetical protein CO029_04355 [Candidatus Magasanikbacteria bacterium CG_4_9_14_0_2_um_filter_41_10]|uniref:Uncharacterized protein n=1 Tax=Candidatus Magasanikbacteria bacterium CG_4_10_14_0_2_um_filter_41_31 TaxID=1974639 RepID=A0A2M7V356_9BACT|nr:MAG: hypothetical protein AUJ37_03380 [Candidatus Magasanikbacteria bacterium CG1_02_41_34]PIZ92899.1 MAG: hypothetical protein COX83_03210 [Candidatus Magasanikbacteria bacterium CG_4_10_14_0_2_um_filter_41_31]PJC53144.1 MAG: hypothetical protein CO029_04355 [Candidatus Magasanikbacteria bacterium CG_4_9_14_0_2_um_filter_41_10]
MFGIMWRRIKKVLDSIDTDLAGLPQDCRMPVEVMIDHVSFFKDCVYVQARSYSQKATGSTYERWMRDSYLAQADSGRLNERKFVRQARERWGTGFKIGVVTRNNGEALHFV